MVQINEEGIGQVGIHERNPKKCRVMQREQFAEHKMLDCKSWIRERCQDKQQMFPRDAGLLEGSTGMGLSLSLLVAAVQPNKRPKNKKDHSQVGGFNCQNYMDNDSKDVNNLINYMVSPHQIVVNLFSAPLLLIWVALEQSYLHITNPFGCFLCGKHNQLSISSLSTKELSGYILYTLTFVT